VQIRRTNFVAMDPQVVGIVRRATGLEELVYEARGCAPRELPWRVEHVSGRRRRRDRRTRRRARRDRRHGPHRHARFLSAVIADPQGAVISISAPVTEFSPTLP